MSKKDFDKLDQHFNKLASEQGATPPDLIWDELDKNLPKKKKNSRWIWMVFMGIVGLGIFLFINIENTQTTLTEVGDSAHHKGQQITDGISTTDNEENKTQEEKAIFQHDAIKETVTQLPSEKDVAIRNHPQTNAEQKKEASIFQNMQIVTNASMNEIVPQNENVNLHDISKNDKIQKVVIGNRITSNITSTLSNNRGKISNTNNPFSTGEVIDEQRKESKISLSDSGSTKINRLQLLTIDLAFVSYEEEVRIAEILTPTIVKIESPKDEQKKGNWYTDKTALIGIHITNLKNQINSDRDYRALTERNWYTWGASLQMGYAFKNGLYVQSGIEFIESRDVFEFNGANVLLEDVMDPTSQNFAVIENVNYFNIGDVTYRQYNIPFTLGGEMTKGKFKIGLQGTAIANVLFKAKGKVMTDFMTFSRVEDENIYKSSLGLGLRSAITFGMDISENATLYARPTFSKYLSNTNKAGATHESSLTQYYLEIGCRYNY